MTAWYSNDFSWVPNWKVWVAQDRLLVLSYSYYDQEIPTFQILAGPTNFLSSGFQKELKTKRTIAEWESAIVMPVYISGKNKQTENLTEEHDLP